MGQLGANSSLNRRGHVIKLQRNAIKQHTDCDFNQEGFVPAALDIEPLKVKIHKILFYFQK